MHGIEFINELCARMGFNPSFAVHGLSKARKDYALRAEYVRDCAALSAQFEVDAIYFVVMCIYDHRRALYRAWHLSEDLLKLFFHALGFSFNRY
jgi:hypothetical protein